MEAKPAESVRGRGPAVSLRPPSVPAYLVAPRIPAVTCRTRVCPCIRLRVLTRLNSNVPSRRLFERDNLEKVEISPNVQYAVVNVEETLLDS